MARIRTIKPEFFRNGKLFRAERASGFPLRVAFAGLWSCADREGRFRWEPDELKLDALPYDEVDFEKVLEALASGAWVVAYEVNGKRYGFIPAWRDHQAINLREAQSVIPAPPHTHESMASTGASTVLGTESNVHAHGEGKGREGKGDVARTRITRTPKTSLPEGFGLSERVIDWAKDHGFGHLQEHLDAFRLKAVAADYRYADWDSAFMEAIRADWAKVNGRKPPIDKFAGAI